MGSPGGPRVQPGLKENVRLNRLENVSCHRFALSNEDAKAKLTLATGGFDDWNSLGKSCMGEVKGSEIVHTVTLDAFTREQRFAGPIAAIKIDVEGWENPVLAGGAKLLAGADAPVLYVEFTEEAARLANSSCAALYHTLESFGYRIFSVDTTPERIVRFAIREPFPNVNLLALKDPDAARPRIASNPRAELRS